MTRGGRLGLLTGGTHDGTGTHGLRQSDDEEGASLLPSEAFELSEDVEGADSPSYQDGFKRQQGFRERFRRWFGAPRQQQSLTIKPLWPSYQDQPSRWLEGRFPGRWQKASLLAAFLCSWLVAFTIPLLLNTVTGEDASGQEIIHLDCTDTLWSRGNECGLDGIDCQPFSNASFAFHCPANCAGVRVLNPHAVGPQDINYRPLVVGGPVYRGDSFLCGSAIHAGVVTDAAGGCGVINRVGRHVGFQASTASSIESIEFDSYFPLSFTVSTEPRARACGKDPRQLLLSISVAFTVLLSILVTSPSVFFFVIFAGVFAEVALASDPPGVSKHATSILPELISAFAGRLLPALFCAAILYQTCVRRTLDGLEGQVEKTILWVGGCWFGALSNYTLAWLPISRLTKHDLDTQPGAKLALAIILVVLLFIILQQAYHFHLEGRLKSKLALYGILLLAIAVGIFIPGLELRLHHYILSLLLLPGTAIQTRPSLVYQGFLIGLFINGIARWNFDSVLQTAEALRGDGEIGSLLPSILSPNITHGPDLLSLALSWVTPPVPSQVDGISILVNDVERHRQYFADSTELPEVFVWNRSSSMLQPEYFRFAYLRDGRSLDYTEASTWDANGLWLPTESG